MLMVYRSSKTKIAAVRCDFEIIDIPFQKAINGYMEFKFADSETPDV